MLEKEYISTIKNILNSTYIGDDCAYLKDLKIVITQDSLIENVHFSTKFITPFQLGYKSIAVNISDIVASGGIPKYITVALSLPPQHQSDFITEFYKGAKSACPRGVEIVGGDLTGSEKICISVCAIGSTNGRNISSRSSANVGYKVILAGQHGLSALGLAQLLQNSTTDNKFTKAHLMPIPQIKFGEEIALTVKEPYAMMDTSDGLMDALSTIATNSNVLLKIDYNKIPIDIDLKKYKDYKHYLLFGGEDYGIVAAIPKHYNIGTEIGEVIDGIGVDLIINNNIEHYSKEQVNNELFKHF